MAETSPSAAVNSLSSSFEQMTSSDVVFASTDTYQFFTVAAGTKAGGTVLVVAFIISVIKQKLSATPNWKEPIWDLIWFTFLLTCYVFVAGTLLRTVMSFGALDPGAVAAQGKTIFVSNLNEFVEFTKKQVQEDNALVAMTAVGVAKFIQEILSTLVAGSYTFAAAVVFALKIIQTTMVKVLWIVGPIMIGVAALPFQLTRRFLSSWVMCVVEVGSWGLFANILLGLMTKSWTQSGVSSLVSDGSVNFFEHMAFNVVYALAFATIPLLAATVIRGGGASGLASAGMGAAGFVAGKASAASRALSGGGGSGGPPAPAPTDKPPPDVEPPGGGAGGGATTAADARRAMFARKGALAKQNRESED